MNAGLDHEYDIVVVGGGPIGASVASKVAKQGFETLIIEEHEKAGAPVQCAGIVSMRFKELVDFEIPILNKARGAVLYPPDRRPYELMTDEDKAIIIDRKEFDKKMLAHASDHGASVNFSTRCVDVAMKGSHAELEVRTPSGTTHIRAKLVIGADGPDSVVRGSLGGSFKIQKLFGVQVEVPKEQLDRPPDIVELHIGNELAPGFFAWMIPAGENFRVGLCTMDPPKKYLHSFIKNIGLKYNDDWPVQAGRVPLGLLDRTHGERKMIVGDAACQVKPLTCGGLYTGLLCAGHCADAAVEAFENENFSSQFLSRYHRAWTSEIGKELKRGLLIRKVYRQMKDRQLNEIVDIFRSKKLISLLISSGDIDFPSRAAKTALLKSPKLIKFSPVLLKSLL